MHQREAIPTRSSLLDRVRDPADSKAWEDFHGTYKGLIRRLALKAGLTEAEADDVVQDVFVSVNRNMEGFDYDPKRCSFKHWLTQMVRWRISDRRAMRIPNAEPLPDATDLETHTSAVATNLEASASPEVDAITEEEWQCARIELATRQVRRNVTSRQFQIFYLRVLKGLSVAEVKTRLNVSAAQIYLAKLRVGRVFRRALADLADKQI